MSSARPTISVIVTAYDRRTFLVSAVASILDQSIPRESYEVIVLRNFADPNIDSALSRMGARIVDFGSPTFGKTIVRAVRESQGDVLVFLEDDDLFDREKLGTVLASFQSDRALAFLWNQLAEVDEQGVRLGRSSRSHPHAGVPSNPTSYGGPEQLDRLIQLTWALPMAHLSCMSVRRTVLESVEEELSRVRVGVDFFLFYASVASGGTVRLDPRELTLYRRHESNFSFALAHDPGRREELLRASGELEVATREVMVRLGASQWLGALEGDLALHRVFLALSRSSSNRREIVDALLGLATSSVPFGKPGARKLVGQALTHCVSPSLARRLFRST